jgi:hypothetical protein
MLTRPERNEYAEYYHLYVGKVPDGDVLELLEKQIEDTVRVLSAVDEKKAAYRYQPDKWSIKQVVGHLCDAERLFQFRSVVFARGDKTPLPSFEQDDYVARGDFDDRTLADIVAEFRGIRASTLAFYRGLSDDAFTRVGNARSSISLPVTKSITWMCCGNVTCR